MKKFVKINVQVFNGQTYPDQENREIILNTDMIVSIRIIEDPYFGRFNVRLFGDNETYVIPFEQNPEFYEFVKKLV